MSAILDALRRARQQGSAGRPAAGATPAPSQVPAALRLGGRGPRGSARGRGRRIAVVIAGLIVVAVLGAWAVMNVRWPARAPRTTVAQRAPAPVRQPPPAPAPAPASSARPQPAPSPSLGNAIDRLQQGGPPPLPSPSQVAKAQESAAAARASKVSRPTERAARPRAAVAAPRAPERPSLPATPPPALTDAAVSARPASIPVDHFALAVKYQSLGDFEQALRHYTAALEADEFNVEARNNLGLLYRGHGLLNEAIDQFRRAISINPDYLKARSNLAVTLMDAGRLAEASAELRAALAIDPRNVDLLVNLALVQKANHQPDAAQETLVRALGINPKHALANYNLALLYEEKGDRAAAYDHYLVFLQNAGPELGQLLSDVQRRADALRKQLDVARP